MGEPMAEGDEAHPRPSPLDLGRYVLISRLELDLIKENIRDAKLAAQSAAVTSASNKQTLDETVKPALVTLQEHEQAIQKARGAMWGVGAVWSVLTLVLSFAIGRVAGG